jgi:hypothetical protein
MNRRARLVEVAEVERLGRIVAALGMIGRKLPAPRTGNALSLRSQ